MKRIITVVLALLILLAFGSCRKIPEAAPAVDQSAASAEDLYQPCITDADGNEITMTIIALWRQANEVYNVDSPFIFQYGETVNLYHDAPEFNELKDYDRVVGEIFTENGIKQLEGTYIGSDKYTLIQKVYGKVYRLGPWKTGSSYADALCEMTLVEAAENRVVVEVKYQQPCLDQTAPPEFNAALFTVAKQNGKWLVDDYVYPEARSMPLITTAEISSNVALKSSYSFGDFTLNEKNNTLITTQGYQGSKTYVFSVYDLESKKTLYQREFAEFTAGYKITDNGYALFTQGKLILLSPTLETRAEFPYPKQAIFAASLEVSQHEKTVLYYNYDGVFTDTLPYSSPKQIIKVSDIENAESIAGASFLGSDKIVVKYRLSGDDFNTETAVYSLDGTLLKRFDYKTVADKINGDHLLLYNGFAETAAGNSLYVVNALTPDAPPVVLTGELTEQPKIASISSNGKFVAAAVPDERQRDIILTVYDLEQKTSLTFYAQPSLVGDDVDFINSLYISPDGKTIYLAFDDNFGLHAKLLEIKIG